MANCKAVREKQGEAWGKVPAAVGAASILGSEKIRRSQSLGRRLQLEMFNGRMCLGLLETINHVWGDRDT